MSWCFVCKTTKNCASQKFSIFEISNQNNWYVHRVPNFVSCSMGALQLCGLY